MTIVIEYIVNDEDEIPEVNFEIGGNLDYFVPILKRRKICMLAEGKNITCLNAGEISWLRKAFRIWCRSTN